MMHSIYGRGCSGHPDGGVIRRLADNVNQLLVAKAWRVTFVFDREATRES